MAETRLLRRSIQLIPEHRILTLRDAECYESPQDAGALDHALVHISACSGTQIFVVASQRVIAVSAYVQLWSGPPAISPGAKSGNRHEPFTLYCPSGELVLGDHTGVPSIAFHSPLGPGDYAVRVTFDGRAEVAARIVELEEAADALPAGRSVDLYRPYAGLESYFFDMWRATSGTQPHPEQD